jgi:hypothetical protein
VKPHALVALLAPTMALAACTEPGRVSTVPITADGWAEIHQAIIAPSCAFGSCHAGAQPAAHLDLSTAAAACAQLVGRTSCLFPKQTLVMVGAPEQSFLLTKLIGDGLAPQPETTCGGPSNQRMPFGALPLPADHIAAIKSWIASGADCGGPPAVPPTGNPGSGDSGDAVEPDGGSDAWPDPLPVVVQAVTIDQPSIQAGAPVAISVVLSGPAPAGGAPVLLDLSDRSIVGAAADLLVPAGAMTTTTAGIGKRPGVVQISARVRGSALSASTSLRVGGLLITEVLAQGSAPMPAGTTWLKVANVSQAVIDLGGYRLSAGRGSLADTEMALQGILAPGTCAVIGGPHSDQDNGAPSYALVWDLSAVLQGHPEDGATSVGIALFDAQPGAASATPAIDELALPRSPAAAALSGSDGLPVPSTGQWPPPGSSLVRDRVNHWISHSTPTPAACDAPADY